MQTTSRRATALITATAFLLLACTHEAPSSQVAARLDNDAIEETGQKVIEAFAAHGLVPDALTPDQRRFIQPFLEAWYDLSPEDQIHVSAFQELVLERAGLKLHDLVSDVARGDYTRIAFAFDDRLERIAREVHRRVATDSGLSDRTAKVFPWIVLLIVVAVVAVAGTAAYTIIAVAQIQGKTCSDFCSNCTSSAQMTCGELGAKVRCSCDGNVQQGQDTEFSKDRSVYKGTGSASSGYVCEYQCN